MLLCPVRKLLGRFQALQTALTPGARNEAVDAVKWKSRSLHSVTSRGAASEGYCLCWESGGPRIVVFCFFF